MEDDLKKNGKKWKMTSIYFENQNDNLKKRRKTDSKKFKNTTSKKLLKTTSKKMEDDLKKMEDDLKKMKIEDEDFLLQLE